MNLLNNGMILCYADSVYPTVISHRVNIYLIRIIGASSRQNTRLSWLIDSHSIRFHGCDFIRLFGTKIKQAKYIESEIRGITLKTWALFAYFIIPPPFTV